MELICKKEALDEKGNKVMNFTKGVIYDFEKIYDPEGWEVADDNGNKEVFFNLNLMFEPVVIHRCKLVPYGNEEKRCVKCGYITWNSDKSDTEIIEDMIKAGYDVPDCDNGVMRLLFTN